MFTFQPKLNCAACCTVQFKLVGSVEPELGQTSHLDNKIFRKKTCSIMLSGTISGILPYCVSLLLNIVLPPTPCTATALRGSHALTDLMLWKCGIESTAMSHLCEGLSTLSTLRVLNLSQNNLGTEGSKHLGKGRLCTL